MYIYVSALCMFYCLRSETIAVCNIETWILIDMQCHNYGVSCQFILETNINIVAYFKINILVIFSNKHISNYL